MKFWEIFRFEFRYQVARPWPWLFFVILLVLNFLMTRDASLSEALYEDFFINSPFAIAKTTVFGSLIWLVLAPVVAGTAAARDIETRMHPLLFTSSINKREYLGGRFLAALTINALLLIAVQLGILLAVYTAHENALVDPFRPASYITGYLYIALPNAFVATAIQFALATASGRPMASYLASVLLIFMGFFVATILLWHRGLGTLLDPTGIRFIVEDIAHLWTTVEKRVRLLSFDGIIKTNRLLWLSIGLAFLALTYWRFTFRHRAAMKFKLKFWDTSGTIRPDLATTEEQSSQVVLHHSVKRSFAFTGQVSKGSIIAWDSFRAMAGSWAGLALLVAIPLMCIPIIIDQMQAGGGMLVPTTIRVLRELTGPLSEELSRWIIIPAFIIYFAGELIWRERDERLDEIVDAMPGSEWTPLIGKFLGLILILVSFATLQMIAGILAQLILNYDKFEILLYLKVLLGLQLPEYLIFAALAMAIHVIVNQKYMGHVVAVLIYVFIALSSLFGVEHNLLIYGASPAWSYTEMRGFAASLTPWIWFKVYWTGWAILLAVVAKLFWVRGKEHQFTQRSKIAKARLNLSAKWTAATTLMITIGVGAFIYYNTNVLNTYYNAGAAKKRQADYEKKYAKFKSIHQPLLTAADLNVEIYPKQKSLNIRGAFHLKNGGNMAIDSILLATVSAVTINDILIDDRRHQISVDDTFGHTLLALEDPLQPGDSITLRFNARYQPQGFRENGVDATVAENGTFFTNALLPSIGYQESRELINPADRREYGLAPRPIIASLYDTAALWKRGSGIDFTATLSTDEDQVAGAPGALLKRWSKNGRSYFQYATSAPIGSEWAFFSARYHIREEKWTPQNIKNIIGKEEGVTIRIFHVPGHTQHLEKMLSGIRQSLQYYTDQFGPYRYTHLTVAEAPGDGIGIHADASMLTQSEGFPLWNVSTRERSVDFPFAIVAHEMAHQWTLPYANVEGAPVMSESIAWYYAFKVVEKAKGLEHLRSLLRTMHEPHPIAPIRRGEPLLRGLDKYLSYRRGPFALYTMSEYVSEQKINQALRQLRDKHRAEDAPLATTLDLYRELKFQTPDSLQYLLHDMFEVNTYWMLSLKEAKAKQSSADEWKVSLDLRARKTVMDSAGVESIVPLNDWVEVCVFGQDDKGARPLYQAKHLITKDRQSIVVKVKSKPSSAGIDPYQLLIDLKTDDNIVAVQNEK